MIKKIKIENFKCFKKLEIDLENINILCGKNSAGKSTIIQTILFFLQNNKKNKETIIYNGDYTHFNTFSQIKNNNSKNEKKIILKLIDNNNKNNMISLEYENNNKIKCNNYKQEINLNRDENIFFLSAERDGPKDIYSNKKDYIGNKGEHIYGLFTKFKNNIIDRSFFPHTNSNPSPTFSNLVNYWLTEIVNEKLRVEEMENNGFSTVYFANNTHSISDNNNPFEAIPYNTGNGISYVSSIIILSLIPLILQTDCMPIIIVENPEIHLHPSAQIKLMDLFSLMSSKAQFIIETQSPYIIESLHNEKVKNKKIYIIKDYNIQNIDSTSFILQRITSAEINYRIFEIPTIEYFIQVFEYMTFLFNKRNKNNNSNNLSFNQIDNLIRQTTVFKNNSKIYDTDSKRHTKDHCENYSYETLPLVIRHSISHFNERKTKIGTIHYADGNIVNFINNVGEFDKLTLEKSIDFMTKIIKEII